MELFDYVIDNFKRFHPKPEEVKCSNPIEEPDFIKPYFGLRLKGSLPISIMVILPL